MPPLAIFRLRSDITPRFREVPIVLQNDFAPPNAQDRFKIGRQCATLIQKSIRADSIVSNFYSTASPRRLLQHYLPNAEKHFAFEKVTLGAASLSGESAARQRGE